MAAVRNGETVTLPDHDGQHLLPSVVRYTEAEPEVGAVALAQAAKDPFNTIVSVKRLMGRGIDDLKALDGQAVYRFAPADGGMPYIETVAGNKSPVQVSADILSSLKVRAEDSLAGELEGAVYHCAGLL